MTKKASLPENVLSFITADSNRKNCIIPPVDSLGDYSSRKSICIPFNFDAEFFDPLPSTPLFDDNPLPYRTGITVQIRGIGEREGIIFDSPDLVDYAESKGLKTRHSVIASPCVVQDWLQARGVDCEIFESPAHAAKKSLPCCTLLPISHFAIADYIYLAGTGEFHQSLVDAVTTRKVRMSRRLVAKSSDRELSSDGCRLDNWCIRLGEKIYKLKLAIADTAGLHGIASYQDLANNTGVELPHKDTFSPAEKSRMLDMYFDRPGDFDAYALGDLYISDIVYGYEKLMEQVWDSLGIAHRYTKPRLTVGTTCAHILTERLNDKFGDGCHTESSNASTLSTVKRQASALLSKVDGGRAYNNYPLLVNIKGVLVDIDIAGAYASAMSVTPLVVGQVRISQWGSNVDLGADLSPCPTLGETLKKLQRKLVPRTWYARISTRKPLSFEQDLFTSWFDYRVNAVRRTDTECLQYDQTTDSDSGQTKILTTELYNATLTSDLLDVLKNTLSKSQLDEFFNSVVVRAIVYVDKSDYVSPSNYKAQFETGSLAPHAWSSQTLGEIISDIFKANRKLYAKKSPLNILFKLFSNTVYGVTVSPLFESSSVISGSNVTATVRSMMWLSEKGLNLVGSITDGQLFDLNRVLQPRRNRKPSPLAVSPRVYQMSYKQLLHDGTATMACIVERGYFDAELSDDKINVTLNHPENSRTFEYREKRDGTPVDRELLDYIDGLAKSHLTKLWPKIPLLVDTFQVVDKLNPDGTVKYKSQTGLFLFESKRLVLDATQHGTANYHHRNGLRYKFPKMRAYESNRRHFAYSVNDTGELIQLSDYDECAPATLFMSQLASNPHAVKILPPFAKCRILKPGAMFTRRNNKPVLMDKFSDSDVNIGDSIYALGQPRLFSLAAFKFRSREQLVAWGKAQKSMLTRQGLSFERYFMNADGLVDYSAMLQAVDTAITSNVVHPTRYFNSRYQSIIPPYVAQYHQARKLFDALLKQRYPRIDINSDESIYASETDELILAE